MLNEILNDMQKNLVAWAGVCVGLISLIWSMLNTFLNFWNARVHIRLIARAYYPYASFGLSRSKPAISVSVVNLSTFSVYIKAVGFCSSKRCWGKVEDTVRVYIGGTESELSSHGALNLQVSGANYEEAIRQNKYMYIQTECGYSLTSRIEP